VTARPAAAADADALLHFLDDLRAAEAASARVFTAWVEACTLDGLRGGLRAIAEREAGHAELLAQRMRELGGQEAAAVSARALAGALARFADDACSDEEKLRLVLGRYPGDRSPTAALDAVVADLDHDPETRELLRLIAHGEAATVGWLRAYHAGLAAHGVPPAR
jgi:hypothetical protein